MSDVAWTDSVAGGPSECTHPRGTAKGASEKEAPGNVMVVGTFQRMWYLNSPQGRLAPGPRWLVRAMGQLIGGSKWHVRAMKPDGDQLRLVGGGVKSF